MKIVQINATYGTGSNGRLAKQIADYVSFKKEESFFVYANGKASAGNIQIGGMLDHKLHALLSRLTGLQGYFSWFETKKMIKRLKTINPDVIHIHNLHSNYINLRLLFNYVSKNNIGLVLTLHDCWYFTGKCVHPIFANCNRFQHTCKDCPQLKSDRINPTLFFDTSTKCQADKYHWFHEVSYDKLYVVDVSKWITQEAAISKIFSDRHCVTIYNWVDRKQFFYERDSKVESLYGISSNQKTVLIVASQMSDRKGYRELLYLADILPEEYQIVYVGDAGSLFMPSRIKHIHRTENIKELRNIYSAANVCVNLSYGETFGMVTVEAMSCGTPVIVYNNTASPELVGPGCGLVINQQENFYPIIDAIKDICSNNKSFYVEKCMDFAHDRFDKDKSLEAYYQLYKRLGCHV